MNDQTNTAQVGLGLRREMLSEFCLQVPDAINFLKWRLRIG